MQETLPGPDQLVKFHAVKEFLDAQLRAIYPRAQIVAYGSLGTNLQLPSSDVDLCITFPGVEVRTCRRTS